MKCVRRSHGKFLSRQWFPGFNKINKMNEACLDLFVHKQRSSNTTQQEQPVVTVLESFAALRQTIFFFFSFLRTIMYSPLQFYL